jgi:hypothetical protein
MSEWQPIETAPKDCSAFIGWQEGWSTGYEVHWVDRIHGGDGGFYIANNDPTDSWGPGELTLTHWQPLPLPPSTERG